MMKKLFFGLGLALAVSAAPLSAGWKLMPPAERVAVANSVLTVVPGEGWNRSSSRFSKKGESWSFDGPILNNIDFLGGIASGEPIAKERNKKDKPLPKFNSAMLPTDVAQMYEQTARILTGSPDFAVESMEPASFAGHQGFRFTFRFTKPDEEITRKGEARGAIVGGRLYLIAYVATALHYFEAHLAAAESVMDSAKVN
jgi:hypothetical protein